MSILSLLVQIVHSLMALIIFLVALGMFVNDDLTFAPFAIIALLYVIFIKE